jgi:hypothetical protein
MKEVLIGIKKETNFKNFHKSRTLLGKDFVFAFT